MGKLDRKIQVLQFASRVYPFLLSAVTLVNEPRGVRLILIACALGDKTYMRKEEMYDRVEELARALRYLSDNQSLIEMIDSELTRQGVDELIEDGDIESKTHDLPGDDAVEQWQFGDPDDDFNWLKEADVYGLS